MKGFANILFSGVCNLRCIHCIGKRLIHKNLPENLDQFPVINIDEFIFRLKHTGIREISVTGTNTDPMLYRHQEKLLQYLRKATSGNVRISLHTNGLLISRNPDIFNLYDRATISMPSFRNSTYRKITGKKIPDINLMFNSVKIPVKLSFLLCDENEKEISEYIERCKSLGIGRIVIRNLYGENKERNPFSGLKPIDYFMNNPVYHIAGVEATLWNFSNTQANCINLFSDGSISDSYILEGRNCIHGNKHFITKGAA